MLSLESNAGETGGEGGRAEHTHQNQTPQMGTRCNHGLNNGLEVLVTAETPPPVWVPPPAIPTPNTPGQIQSNLHDTCVRAAQAVAAMGWSDVETDSCDNQPPREPPGRHGCGRSRSSRHNRTRSPSTCRQAFQRSLTTRVLQTHLAEPREPTPREGTTWWQTPLWNSMSHYYRRCGGQAAKFQILSVCSGMVTEACIAPGLGMDVAIEACDKKRAAAEFALNKLARAHHTYVERHSRRSRWSG